MRPVGRRIAGARSTTVYRWIGGLEDIVFGRVCALCGDPLYKHRARPSQVCRACTARVYRAALEGISSRCSMCGRPLLREQGSCTSCRKLERAPDFDSHSAGLEYRGVGEELIAAFKMQRKRAIVRLAASLVVGSISAGVARSLKGNGAVSSLESRVDEVCVPVPPGSLSAKRRDFQPVDLLAREVGRLLDIPVEHLLVRIGKGLDQKKLGREERARNVSGKFAFHGNPPAPPVIWLIDDVYTTGATVSECAKVLKQAGAEEVHVRTVAMD